MDDRTLDQLEDNHVDDHVEIEIENCLNASSPKSFFTYAGAGSGKTRTLVNTLKFIEKQYGAELSTYSKQVAVITYTNAACDEILSRIEYSSIFLVSTIHSFLWELICPYQHDIKKWIKEDIEKKLIKTERDEAKGRKGTNASKERLRKIATYNKRLQQIDSVMRFSYNPNGENTGYDSLNHSDVIKIGAEFIKDKPMMQKILISKFPILLIDESQDTKKELVDALLNVQKKHSQEFTIGMFGDTMQKIYLDGKDNLEKEIPDDWVKPIKIMNHRSSVRVVQLANAIRKFSDDKTQKWRSDVSKGVVHLFIARSGSNKLQVETDIAKRMAEITSDNKWLDSVEYECLILEHSMAASRMGFSNLFSTLYRNKKIAQSVLDGSLTEARLFSHMVFPLITACHSNDKFQMAKIIKQYSPLVNKESYLRAGENQIICIKTANSAVQSLYKLFGEDRHPTCIDVINEVHRTGLFELSDRMVRIVTDYVEGEDELVDTLHQALLVPVDEMKNYCAYTLGETSFATHQGVKGLEYPRVMVIMDDSESEGTLFSYEKLFGAQNKSETDIKNESEGKDNSISRTRRLFYVACTRAQDSLALVAYTQDPETVKEKAISNNWFTKDEIEYIEFDLEKTNYDMGEEDDVQL